MRVICAANTDSKVGEYSSDSS